MKVTPRLFYNRFTQEISNIQVLPKQRRMTTSASTSSKGPHMISKQPFKAFLVLDIEGTCDLDTDYDYPNEIIVRAC